MKLARICYSCDQTIHDMSINIKDVQLCSDCAMKIADFMKPAWLFQPVKTRRRKSVVQP